MSGTNPDAILYCNSFQEFLGEDILQVLKCGICLEFYDNPVVLPCGHTFCYNCLLQMGKHANRNKNFVPVHDLTIGCPNCRCPIFVIALLKRDVTLNYPIQSLIDGLKARHTNKPKMVDESTNTETPEPVEKESKKENEKIPFLSSKEFETISKEFERFVLSLDGGSVVNDAFYSIEKIRMEHLSDISNKTASQENYTASTSKQLQNTEDADFLLKTMKFQTKLSRDEVGYDPAIVSYSVSGGKNGIKFPRPENLSIY